MTTTNKLIVKLKAEEHMYLHATGLFYQNMHDFAYQLTIKRSIILKHILEIRVTVDVRQNIASNIIG